MPEHIALNHLTFRETFGPRRDPIVAALSPHTVDYGAHDHDFIEVALVIGGEAVHVTINGEQPIRSGDVVILRPGAWHAYRHVANLTLYNCCFSAELLSCELAWMREDPAMDYLLWSGPLASNRRGVLTFALGDSLLDECRNRILGLQQATQDPTSHRAEQVGCLLRLLASLATGTGSASELGNESIPIHPAVRRATRLIEEHAARAWTLGELANETRLASSYLVRLFRKSVGLPPMAYLCRVRLERAAAMLLRTDGSIGEIANRVGWADPNYFSRRFKAHFGVSAREYRARYKTLARHDAAFDTDRD